MRVVTSITESWRMLCGSSICGSMAHLRLLCVPNSCVELSDSGPKVKPLTETRTYLMLENVDVVSFQPSWPPLELGLSELRFGKLVVCS
mmetsp:Transcript_33446/g.53919  ORF Transcript_33446/g.53919 Transcript_33446/m.53919 type:complete len:89 (-) Transcript_33446:203-469(-)